MIEGQRVKNEAKACLEEHLADQLVSCEDFVLKLEIRRFDNWNSRMRDLILSVGVVCFVWHLRSWLCDDKLRDVLCQCLPFTFWYRSG